MFITCISLIQSASECFRVHTDRQNMLNPKSQELQIHIYHLPEWNEKWISMCLAKVQEHASSRFSQNKPFWDALRFSVMAIWLETVNPISRSVLFEESEINSTPHCIICNPIFDLDIVLGGLLVS